MGYVAPSSCICLNVRFKFPRADLWTTRGGNDVLSTSSGQHEHSRPGLLVGRELDCTVPPVET